MNDVLNKRGHLYLLDVEGVVQGYFFKAASMGIHLLTVADTAEVVIQAQVAQTIGMRLLFFFPVTVRARCSLSCSC